MYLYSALHETIKESAYRQSLMQFANGIEVIRCIRNFQQEVKYRIHPLVCHYHSFSKTVQHLFVRKHLQFRGDLIYIRMLRVGQGGIGFRHHLPTAVSLSLCTDGPIGPQGRIWKNSYLGYPYFASRCGLIFMPLVS